MERYMSSGKCFRPPQKEKKNPVTACFRMFLALCGCPEERDDDSAHFFPPLETCFWIGEGKKRKKVVILGIPYEF